MLIYVRVFLHHLSCMMDIPLFRTGAPRGRPYQLLAVSRYLPQSYNKKSTSKC